MRKLTTCLLFTVFIITVSLAQSRYVFIEFKDAQKPAIANEYPYPEKTVANAIDDKMGKLGYKGKESKGFIIYKGVTLSQLGSQSYDMYFKIDRKSKRDKENTSVNLMLAKGNEIFVTESDDASTISNAKIFMDSLDIAIEAYDLEQQIASQESDFNKAQKKYQGMLDDAEKLQKSKKKIEKDIEDNLKDQKNQQSEVEKQKQIFETLKSKRKA
jgi:hypothetical protein